MAKYRIDYKDKKVIDKTNDLVIKSQAGDSRAENELVNLYSEYIDYMVNKYSMKTPIKNDDDLRSAIYEGFIKGTRRYETGHDTQFIYFVHNWMKKMIFVEAQQNFRIVRLPVNQGIFKDSFESKHSISLQEDLLGTPGHEDFSIFMDPGYLGYLTITETETRLFSELHNSSDHECNNALIDNIYSHSPDGDRIETINKLNQNINKILRKFSEEEQEIMCRLFGLNDYTQSTAEDIAFSLNVTRAHVLTTKARILRLLRHSIFTNILLKDI